MNDTQSGRVVVNWRVTAGIMVATFVILGQFLDLGFLFSVFAGLFSVAVWLGLELVRWDEKYGVDE